MKSFYFKSLCAIFFCALLLGTTRHAQAQYCVDNLYSYGCQFGDYINDVSVGSISQIGTGCGSNGYSDYTSLSATFEQTSTNTLTVTVGNYYEYVSMWIDFNDDYTFDASEK